MSIMRWVDDKESTNSLNNNNASSANNNNENNMEGTAIFGLGAGVIPPFKRDLLQYLLLVSFFT